MDIDEVHDDISLFGFLENIKESANSGTINVGYILKVQDYLGVGAFENFVEVQLELVCVKKVNFFLQIYKQYTVLGFKFYFHRILLLTV